MEIGELFQKIPISGFTFLDPAFDSGEPTLACINIVPGFVALVEQRLLLRFELDNSRTLFTRISLPFLLDSLYPFLNARNSKSDFFLLLLQLFQRNDLVAQLGKIGRLRSAFAPEIDFTSLEKPPLVTKRDACPLALHLESEFAKACANETHVVTLYECMIGKRNFGLYLAMSLTILRLRQHVGFTLPIPPVLPVR